MDLTTPTGQVRLLISDVRDDVQYLTDAEVAGYLALNGGNVRLAAADALEAIAASEVLVSKVITTQDLSTDGAKVADALRALAASLRKRAADDKASEDGDDYAFAVVGGVGGPLPGRPELTEWPIVTGL